MPKVKVLKQTAGTSLRFNAQSSQGFVKGENYISVAFQNADAQGNLDFQCRCFAQEPKVSSTGVLMEASSDVHGFGVRVLGATKPDVAYDPALTFLENMNALGLVAVPLELQKFNPDAKFVVQELTTQK